MAQIITPQIQIQPITPSTSPPPSPTPEVTQNMQPFKAATAPKVNIKTPATPYVTNVKTGITTGTYAPGSTGGLTKPPPTPKVDPKSTGLGMNAETLNGLAQLGGVAVAGLNYLETKKVNEQNRKKTEWEANQQTKAANNKLKWSKGLQNSLEGKDTGSENQRQEYDNLSL